MGTWAGAKNRIGCGLLALAMAQRGSQELPTGAREWGQGWGSRIQDLGFQGRGQSPAWVINTADTAQLRAQGLEPTGGRDQQVSSVPGGSTGPAPMAFLVAGALRVAAQMADARESLGRKGKYCVLGPRVALTLSSPGVSATTVTALEGVFSALGFESCWRREASVPGFLEELAWFREQVDARRGPVGCAGVALVAPEGQLRQSQRLVQELSRCRALWGRPKLFLLLSSAPGGKQRDPRLLGPGKGQVGVGRRPGCFLHLPPSQHAAFSTQQPWSPEPSSQPWVSSVAVVLTGPCCSC
ncbi:uncharacterized protein LOC143667627 [Tamandua tetradactyla]|uniref:uncharacterized protein LOC143667627 n=1 Tax=Tamandua tetradactyla TaxID=48850 RepID=UPI00405459E7